MFSLLVSARRRDVASVAGLWFTDRLFLFFFYYSGTDLSRYLSDRRNFFTITRVITSGCQRRSWISKILLTYFTGCNKPLKNAFFHVLFTGWPHVFDRCAKTVFARRNLKTNVSSTMNYLSSDITLITVVLVILQITAWENWSSSKNMCSSLMGTLRLLHIVLLLTTFDIADDKFDFAPVQWPDMRSSRRKKILVQGDKPQKMSVN